MGKIVKIKHKKVKFLGKIIKVNNKYFLDLPLKEYGNDEAIEKFLRILFEGL